MLSSQISYQIIRSSRKTMSLEIKADGSVVVRAPLRLSEAKIQKFVEEKQEWIWMIIMITSMRESMLQIWQEPGRQLSTDLQV